MTLGAAGDAESQGPPEIHQIRMSLLTQSPGIPLAHASLRSTGPGNKRQNLKWTGAESFSLDQARISVILPGGET